MNYAKKRGRTAFLLRKHFGTDPFGFASKRLDCINKSGSIIDIFIEPSARLGQPVSHEAAVFKPTPSGPATGFCIGAKACWSIVIERVVGEPHGEARDRIFDDPCPSRALKFDGMGSQRFGRIKLLESIGAGSVSVQAAVQSESPGKATTSHSNVDNDARRSCMVLPQSPKRTIRGDFRGPQNREDEVTGQEWLFDHVHSYILAPTRRNALSVGNGV
ncbi:MAG TPA: hypothetical protein VFN18_05570 [Solirubrobacterales bacterium]|nr:hypothetical protein [Solirubrobacterales bacterium]